MNQITMLDTIVPKSDQLNADDLIGGPRTIRLTKVSLTGDEQPVALHFEGDNGKPYKPGKSMRRVLVRLWGPDANVYAGRSLTLYRDDKIMFGGVAVGGIRISHMSDIAGEQTIALTATRAQRRPFTVKPLRVTAAQAQRQAPPAAREVAPISDDDFPGGFGAAVDDDGEISDAVMWMRTVMEDLEADAFKTDADIGAFLNDPANVSLFQALSDEAPELAKRLEAAMVGRRKAMASRR